MYQKKLIFISSRLVKTLFLLLLITITTTITHQKIALAVFHEKLFGGSDTEPETTTEDKPTTTTTTTTGTSISTATPKE